MQKILINNDQELEQFILNEKAEYQFLHSPESYPAVLVYYWYEGIRQDYYMMYEWVYLNDILKG